MTPERLQELLGRFPSRRIAVIGDFFLDKYLDTDPALVETSVETGKDAHQVADVRRSAGAAGTVVNNLAALEAGALHAFGAAGDDGEAYDLRRCLQSIGCSTAGLLQFNEIRTPTYLKPRDMTDPGLSGEHERYDTKNRRPLPGRIGADVLAALDNVLPEIDAVIIADQVEADDCGVVTRTVRQELARRARRLPHVVFFADSRTHIHEFEAVVIKPNQFEAVGHAHPRPGEQVDLTTIRDALGPLRARTGAPVCITLGGRGMLVSDPEPTHVPGVRVDGPLDTTGAGDSTTAGMVLALASGATLPEAALVGNLAASITIQQLATTGTATPRQILERLDLWRSQQSAPP